GPVAEHDRKRPFEVGPIHAQLSGPLLDPGEIQRSFVAFDVALPALGNPRRHHLADLLKLLDLPALDVAHLRGALRIQIKRAGAEGDIVALKIDIYVRRERILALLGYGVRFRSI